MTRPALGTLIELRSDTAEPLYRQLETQLRALIATGPLKPGTTLPAERILADDLGISRTTVKRCYGLLRDDHLISAQGRLGFIVKGPTARLDPGLDRLKGFTEEMQALGRVPTSDILDCSVVRDRQIASIFGLPTTAPLLRLDRVRRGDGIPLSHELAWYNLSVVPSLADLDLSGSVYGRLKELGTLLTHCEQWIEATMPTAAECEIFGFSAPVPCLLIKRRSYDQTGRMMEYVEGLFRGDTYAYRLQMQI